MPRTWTVVAVLAVAALGTVLAPPAPGLAPTAGAGIPAEGSLPAQAQALADAGRPLDAWHLLADRLVRELPVADLGDPRALAEAEIAALKWIDLTVDLDAWPEALEALQPLTRWVTGAPPRLAFLLEYLRGVALRNAGQPEAARAVTAALGFVNDVLVIGPFDNERGAGFDVAYPPESSVDTAVAVPGKERPVSWRANPGREHPLALIALHQMLQPSEQAVAYVATAIRSDAGQTVVLHLGSSCAAKVFLNGGQALARKVRRPFFVDQDRVALELQPGWNQLLVKAGVETGPWLVALRFTDLAGRPLAGLGVDSSQVGNPSLPFVAATEASSPEERDVLAPLVDDASAQRLLALHHLIVHPDDIVDRSARAAAERAVALDPGNAQGHYLLALGNDPEGASREEMEVNQRLHALKDTLERDPHHVAALLDLAEFSMDLNPLPSRADDLTARALADAPQSWRALTMRARLLASRDRDAEAEQLRRQAEDVPEALVREDGRLARAERLLEHGQREAAVGELESAFGRRALPGRVMDRLTDLLVDLGETEAALALTRRSLAGAPFEVDRMLETAERLEYAGRVPEARGLVDAALAVCPESTDGLAARARLCEKTGDLPGAQVALAEIVRLQPGDTKSQRHRQLLMEPGAQDRFEEPYRKDAVALASTPMPTGEENEPLEVLDRTTVYRVQPDGTQHNYEHLVLRALNQGGVKQLDSWSIPSSPDTNVQVYNVRLIHPDGSFERAPPPRGSWKYYDIPPVKVGDLLDVEYRSDDTRAGVFGEYFGTRHEFYADVFDGLLPARRSELVVIAPADQPVYASVRRGEGLEHSVATDDKGLTVMRWVATGLPRPPTQSAMPGRSELAPVVDVTTFKDWDAFATWWWAFIEKEFDTTPAMRDKVAELTAGMTSEKEKVAAIARFVGQEIRYNSWPFGTHGYEPFNASTIFERRFGDCKDKSILMKQMLAQVGVDAVPVLINAEHSRADEPLSSAMIGLFNHCITYVTPTADRPGYYLDGTADRNPVDYLRADDQGARVLHVTSKGAEIHDIPYAPPDQNTLRRRYVVTLAPDGTGEVTLKDESNGYFAVMLRYRFGGEKGDIEKNLSQMLSGPFGKVDIRQVATSDLEDITAPATLDATFSARNLWTPEGGGRTLRLGFDDLGLENVAAESEAERAFDLVLDRPFAQDTTVLWKLPAGARVGRLPSDVDVDLPGLLRYSLQVRAVDGGVAVHRRLELQQRRISRADYGSFRTALRDVQLAETRTVPVEPPPGAEEPR